VSPLAVNDSDLQEIRTTLAFHTDLLALINAQCVTHTARMETILSVLRQVLAKHGIEPAKAKTICEEIFAACLAVAQAENEQIRCSAGKTQLPPSSGPDAARN